MRVLWSHNFDPDAPGGQLFISTAAAGMRARGIDLEFAHLGNLRSPANLRKARAALRERARGFDVVHAQYGSACALATAGVQGVPKVVTLRGSDWYVHRGKIGFRWAHSRLAHAMTARALPAFDRAIAVSNRMAADVRRVARPGAVAVMPSPIDLQRFVPRDRAEARAALGHAGAAEKWVLFNALDVNDANKRFGLAERAVALAAARCGDVRLRVATGMPHADLPVFTAACDALLCTSGTEGWPNAVKEALACNVPFVSTDVSDLRDIARDEPLCRVCPPDAETLARNLCEVLAAPRPATLRRHVAEMSVDGYADRLAAVYRSLVRSH